MVPVSVRPFAVLVVVAFIAQGLYAVPSVDAAEPLRFESPTLVIEDPIGDVGPLGIGVEGNPAMVLYQHIDIVRVEVGSDDADRFQVRIGVTGWDPAMTVPAQAAALTDFSCRVRFTYQHEMPDIEYSYELGFSGDLTRIPGSEPGQLNHHFYYQYREANRGRGSGISGNTYLGFDVSWESETDTFVMDIQKDAVPVWPGGLPASLGDRLLLQWVSCATDIALYGQMSDPIVTDETSLYAFAYPGPGRDIRIRFAGDKVADPAASGFDWSPRYDRSANPVTELPAGISIPIPLHLENPGKERRLVLLEPFVSDTNGDWNLTLASSLFLDPDQSRTVTLIVRPPPGATLGSEHTVKVIARVAGTDDIGIATRTLRIAPILDHDHNTFQIHVRPWETDSINGVLMEAIPGHEVRASLLPSLEGFPNDPAPLGAATTWSGSHTFAPLIRPVLLDLESPVEITLGFTGSAENAVRFGMSLVGEESGTIFNVQREVPADGVTTLQVPIQLDEDRLPAGEVLYFGFGVGHASLEASNLQTVHFDPKASSFTLPVLPLGSDLTVTDGRFLPTLGLARGESATTYMNPGKEYAFDLVLANEGIETDDVRVEIEPVNTTGWETQVLPGKTYRLTPGNSTPFAIVLFAPETGEEGERAQYDVRVRSVNDPDVNTRMRLTAVLTTGVDLPSKPFEAREGQLDPLIDEAESPGPRAFLAASVIAALFVALRRPSQNVITRGRNRAPPN